jgi:hypothetical protein
LPSSIQDERYDIEEASKCLALRRNTATVYHLMKVMESMVRKLADKAGTVAGNKVEVLKPNGDFKDWGSILSALKTDAIDVMGQKGMGDAVQEWTSIKNLLYAVKEAWRNEVMHTASKYTDEEAEEIFSTVTILVRSLVKLL